MTPFAINFLIMSIGVTLSFAPRSRTVIVAGSSTGGGGGGGATGRAGAVSGFAEGLADGRVESRGRTVPAVEDGRGAAEGRVVMPGLTPGFGTGTVRRTSGFAFGVAGLVCAGLAFAGASLDGADFTRVAPPG